MEEQSDKNTQVALEEKRVLFWLVKRYCIGYVIVTLKG